MTSTIFEAQTQHGFAPLLGMPQWTDAMHRACLALGQGRLPQAQTWFDTAWRLAGSQLGQVPDPGHDACVQAWVSSGMCLSSVQSSLGAGADLSTLAETHLGLARLIQNLESGHSWRKAAVWRSRETHAALAQHWQSHGPDPRIEAALRASCMVLRLSPKAGVH